MATRGGIIGGGIGVLMLVAGCMERPAPQPFPVTPPQVMRPEVNPRIQDPQPRPSSLINYYAAIQQRLLRQGKMRKTSDDVSFTPETLAQDFIDIALRDEYALVDGQLSAGNREARLRRWESSFRWQVHFGDSVAPQTARTAHAEITDYFDLLASLSGLTITEQSAEQFSPPHMNIYMLDAQEVRTSGDEFSHNLGFAGPQTRDVLTSLGKDTYCAVATVARENLHTYNRALVIIRAEHPDLFRLACIHEELAQSLGLANDSPAARPSIFNDDDEFALLTQHDKYLIQMLYDPRLRPGMDSATAAPIVLEIARQLMSSDAVDEPTEGVPDGYL